MSVPPLLSPNILKPIFEDVTFETSQKQSAQTPDTGTGADEAGGDNPFLAAIEEATAHAEEGLAEALRLREKNNAFTEKNMADQFKLQKMGEAQFKKQVAHDESQNEFSAMMAVVGAI